MSPALPSFTCIPLSLPHQTRGRGGGAVEEGLSCSPNSNSLVLASPQHLLHDLLLLNEEGTDDAVLDLRVREHTAVRARHRLAALRGSRRLDGAEGLLGVCVCACVCALRSLSCMCMGGNKEPKPYLHTSQTLVAQETGRPRAGHLLRLGLHRQLASRDVLDDELVRLRRVLGVVLEGKTLHHFEEVKGVCEGWRWTCGVGRVAGCGLQHTRRSAIAKRSFDHAGEGGGGEAVWQREL